MQLGEFQRRVTPFGSVDRRHDAPQFHVAVEHELDGGPVARRDLLFDMRNLELRRTLYVASIRGQQPQHCGEQRRLAAAIGTGETGLLTAKQREISLLEQRLGAATQRQVTCG